MPIFIDMIRNGQFAYNYEFKLVLILIGILICVFFILFQDKKDYFYIFITGMVVWSGYETIITFLGIRGVIAAYFMGRELNWLIAVILRGSSEGAVVALVGIIFGDYIPHKKYRKIAIPTAIIVLFYFVTRTLMNSLPSRDIGGAVGSRREVFEWQSVLFFVIISFIVISWYIKENNAKRKKRARNMFIVLIIFSSIWSIAQYIANTRWIEMKTNTLLAYTHAPFLVEVFVFSWDIIFEISMCYVSFLVIPYFFILIRNEESLIK